MDNMKIVKQKPMKYPTNKEIIVFGNDVLQGIDLKQLSKVPDITISINRNIDVKYPVKSPEEVAQVIRDIINPLVETQELFICLYLNVKNEIISVYRHSAGTTSSTLVDTKIILLGAIRQLAASIIIAHNHPSGSTVPSPADSSITKMIKAAGETHGIKLLDSMIVTKRSFYSFANENKEFNLSGIIYPINGLPEKRKTKQTQNIMITKTNLKDRIDSIDLSEDKKLREDDESISDITSQFTDFSFTDADPELNVFVDQTIDDLNQHVKSKAKEADKPDEAEEPVKTEKRKSRSAATKKPKAEKQRTEKPKKVKVEKPKRVKKEKTPKPKKQDSAEYVESVLPEVRIIKRYVGMDGKNLTKEKILTFISTIQRLIRSHAIRKTSKYADEVMHVQNELIKAWNKHKNSSTTFLFNLDSSDNAVMQSYRQIANSQKPCMAIRLIKRYIAIHGKNDVYEKALGLRLEIASFLEKDPDGKYATELKELKKHLFDFIDGKTLSPELTEQQLNGFQGLGLIDYRNLKKGDDVAPLTGVRGKVIKAVADRVGIDATSDHHRSKKKLRKHKAGQSLGECPCQVTSPTLGSIAEQPNIMPASDFKKMDFSPVGYKGKWLSLIGDPVEPFMLMCWSKPGKGKTTLMIEFAGYLAAELSKKVLFVSKEEGLNHTLKDKFSRMNAFSPNIFVSESIPADLSAYNYVFLDSVNQLQLSIEDISALKDKYPLVSFILIFQATVDGNYRGTKDFEHLVDVSININDQGYASAQKTRFGGNGTINVFQEEFEEIYKFTTLQDAERFRDKKKIEGISLRIAQGDDGKIWVIKNEKAEQLYQKGFTIL